MTGYRKLSSDNVKIRCDDNPEIEDRAIDLVDTLEFEETLLANCLGILVRSTYPAGDLLATGKVIEEDGIQKARYDGIFIDFPKDVIMTTHVIRPDLSLFFLEHK